MKSSYFLIIAGLLAGMSAISCSEQKKASVPEASFSQQQSPIVNGFVDYNEVYMGGVAIMVIGHPQYAEQVVCTGTLISPRHVLTAAHCVANQSSYYTLLDEDSSDPDCKWKGAYLSSGAKPMIKYMKINTVSSIRMRYNHYYDIKRVYYHSDYASVVQAEKCSGEQYKGYEVTRGDIAILELAYDVPESLAKPVPILPPWLGMTQKKVDEGLKVVFAGYGFDQDGQKGTKRHFMGPVSKYCGTDGESICPYGETVHVQGCHPNSASCLKFGNLDYYDDYVAMPAGSFFYLQPEGGPCNGDSGGPAYLNVGGRYYIAGITSYGDNACRAYGVSTAVQDYYDWIVNIVPSAGDPSNFAELCNNGIDDDNNGKIDHEDVEPCKDAPFCGNGIVEPGEDCDGTAFRKNPDGGEYNQCTDWSWEYESGLVSCNKDCSVSYENCVEYIPPNTCGDGVLDDGESCDGDVFRLNDKPSDHNHCAEFSGFFASGTVSCYENCTLNTEKCSVSDELNNMSFCGDGILTEGEICDGKLFADGVATECSAWDPVYTDGTVRCNKDCDIDLSKCVEKPHCGDSIRSSDEDCDGSDFYNDLTSCNDWSARFASGSVRCHNNCTIDYSHCELSEGAKAICGNGVLDTLEENGAFVGVEECDGDAFVNGNNCADWSDLYIGGKVVCDDNCTVSFDGCILASGDVYFEDDNTQTTNALKNKTKPVNKAPAKKSNVVSFDTSEENLMEPWVAEYKSAHGNLGGGGASQGNNDDASSGSGGGCSISHSPSHQGPLGLILFGLPLFAACIRRKRS